jgi:hypothetical protein
MATCSAGQIDAVSSEIVKNLPRLTAKQRKTLLVLIESMVSD